MNLVNQTLTRDLTWTPTAKTGLLDRTQWCSDFSYAQMETLARYLAVWETSPGEVLVREGAREAFMGIVAEGHFEIRQGAAGDGERVVALSRGATFGEMALLDGQPRSASVVSVGRGLVLALPAAHLERLVHDHPRLGVAVYRKIGALLSARVRFATGRLTDLAPVA